MHEVEPIQLEFMSENNKSGDILDSLQRMLAVCGEYRRLKDLSEKSGISRSTISKIKNGDKGVCLYTVQLLFDAMGYELIARRKEDRHD